MVRPKPLNVGRLRLIRVGNPPGDDLVNRAAPFNRLNDDLWDQFYAQGCSPAAFRPEMRPKARHSPMLPVP